MRNILMVGLVTPMIACGQPDVTFVPSRKSPLELRAAQTRLVPSDADSTMRDVIATLHDLGYRITKAEPGAGTVSATRQTALRMAVVIRPRAARESVVRANATVLDLYREGQVDSAEFYQRDFFAPLSAMLHRDLATPPIEEAAPEPVRPVAESNTIKDREAAVRKASATEPSQTIGINHP
jgi:hypothetical protein